MTVRAIACTVDGKTANHSDHSTTLPSGRDAILVYDDTKVNTVGKLRTLMNTLMAQAMGSSYFPN